MGPVGVAVGDLVARDEAAHLVEASDPPGHEPGEVITAVVQVPLEVAGPRRRPERC